MPAPRVTRALAEGRCLRCGRRVTLAADAGGHWRDGGWCGPVETHHPSVAPDEPANGWRVR
jgi:hypothetical protein